MDVTLTDGGVPKDCIAAMAAVCRSCQLRRSTGQITELLVEYKSFTQQNVNIRPRFKSTRIPFILQDLSEIISLYQGSIRFCDINQMDTFRTAQFRSHPPPAQRKWKNYNYFPESRYFFFYSALLPYERIWDREMGCSAILSRKPDTASYQARQPIYCSCGRTAPAAEHW